MPSVEEGLMAVSDKFVTPRSVATEGAAEGSSPPRLSLEVPFRLGRL